MSSGRSWWTVCACGITNIQSSATPVEDLSIADLGAIADGLLDSLTETVHPPVDGPTQPDDHPRKADGFEDSGSSVNPVGR